MSEQQFNFNIDDPQTFIDLGCVCLCVCCAALAAGMTIGLLSLDSLKLKIKLAVGTEAEKKAARTILPLIKNHHYLLCTLLLFNASSNEALPIFLDNLVPSWCAVVISVTLVLICGEVIPTAIFSGPHQLIIASRFTWLIYGLEFLFFPIAYPMSLLLDYVLGVEEEDDAFNRDEMSAMMQIIRDERTKSKMSSVSKVEPELEPTCMPRLFHRSGSKAASPASNVHIRTPSSTLNTIGESAGNDNGFAAIPEDEVELSTDEINVIGGVLSLSKTLVRDILIPMSEVNMLSSDQVLNIDVVRAIEQVGHSRLPVFRGSDLSDIVGFFLVKRLMSVYPDRATPLSSLPLNAPIVVGANLSVLDAMATFQASCTHLALVSEEPHLLKASIAAGCPPKPSSAPIGILTIEDIFEEMLQADITDETDEAQRESRMSASTTLRAMSMNRNLSMDVTPLPLQSILSMQADLRDPPPSQASSFESSGSGRMGMPQSPALPEPSPKASANSRLFPVVNPQSAPNHQHHHRRKTSSGKELIAAADDLHIFQQQPSQHPPRTRRRTLVPAEAIQSFLRPDHTHHADSNLHSSNSDDSLKAPLLLNEQASSANSSSRKRSSSMHAPSSSRNNAEPSELDPAALPPSLRQLHRGLTSTLLARHVRPRGGSFASAHSGDDQIV